MSEAIKQLITISRAEFLLPNLGSLILGLAWGAEPRLSLTELVVSIVLSFTIINISSAIGAQANTISDYELDSKDYRKTQLVQALDKFGHNRLKKVLIIEVMITLALVVMFMFVTAKPVLFIMRARYLYSAPPLRIKSKSWLAPVTLILVLAILPVLFAYFTFTSTLNTIFLLALVGLALTVYSVIIPTEIRDYFGDKAMGIETMTVHLDLVKASILSIILLSLGGSLTGIAYFITFYYRQYPQLSLLVFAIAAAVLIVLRNLHKIHALSKEYINSSDQKPIIQEIVRFSANNPKWIMLITQTYSLLSIIFLVSKFLS